MVSPAKVMEPSAKARPSTNDVPVTKVIALKAMMFPWKAVPVPRVALLPTAQKTLEAVAVPFKTTEPAVVRLVPIWKIKQGFAIPLPSKVTAPVIPRAPPVGAV